MDGELSADTITSTVTRLLGTQNAVESLTQFVHNEIDAALQENLTVSTSESRATNFSWGGCSFLCCTKQCYHFLP